MRKEIGGCTQGHRQHCELWVRPQRLQRWLQLGKGESMVRGRKTERQALQIMYSECWLGEGSTYILFSLAEFQSHEAVTKELGTGLGNHRLHPTDGRGRTPIWTLNVGGPERPGDRSHAWLPDGQAEAGAAAIPHRL